MSRLLSVFLLHVSCQIYIVPDLLTFGSFVYLSYNLTLSSTSISRGIHPVTVYSASPDTVLYAEATLINIFAVVLQIFVYFYLLLLPILIPHTELLTATTSYTNCMLVLLCPPILDNIFELSLARRPIIRLPNLFLKKFKLFRCMTVLKPHYVLNKHNLPIHSRNNIYYHCPV